MTQSIDYYHLGNHPVSFAVQMVANLAGVHLLHNDYIADELTVFLLRPGEKRTEHMLVLASNKAHIMDNGFRVTGDINIMRYLVVRYMPNDTHLYPRDLIQRASCDRLMWNLINSVCPLFSDMQLAALPHPPDSVARDELMEEFVDDITFLEDLLRRQDEGKLYMFGDHLTVADVTIAAIFTARYEVELELDELPRLNNYLDRLESVIPGYQEIQCRVEESIQRATEQALADLVNRLRERVGESAN